MFVGNIYDGMADIVLRQILSLFGNVQGWNRIREPSGTFSDGNQCIAFDHVHVQASWEALVSVTTILLKARCGRCAF
jgi:hypothetical protein